MEGKYRFPYLVLANHFCLITSYLQKKTVLAYAIYISKYILVTENATFVVVGGEFFRITRAVVMSRNDSVRTLAYAFKKIGNSM